jgi:hypothetical protein
MPSQRKSSSQRKSQQTVKVVVDSKPAGKKKRGSGKRVGKSGKGRKRSTRRKSRGSRNVLPGLPNSILTLVPDEALTTIAKAKAEAMNQSANQRLFQALKKGQTGKAVKLSLANYSLMAPDPTREGTSLSGRFATELAKIALEKKRELLAKPGVASSQATQSTQASTRQNVPL